METSSATYVEHILAPTLKPGEIVIMDNLSIHKGKKVQDRILARGCQVLFLPTYSPDLSPERQRLFPKSRPFYAGLDQEPVRLCMKLLNMP